MDITNHLFSFKIENFKRFESFEMKDLGSFNLIVGDNNSGKTSLLEALLIDDQNGVASINNFRQAILNHKVFTNPKYRELNYFRNIESHNFKTSFYLEYLNSKSEVSFEFDPVNIRFKIWGIPNGSFDYFYNDPLLSVPDFPVPFIPFYKGYDSDLITYYSSYLQSYPKQKEKLFKYMRVIVPDLVYIEPTAPKSDESLFLIVTQQSRNSTLPLGFYGDGTIKLFRILLEILVNKGKRLMIDEIDTGIHYSRFKQFWTTILIAARENSVQLFMTTHNEECIKYFIEALSDEDMKGLQEESRGISMIELPDKSVKSYTYSFENLEANMAMGNEIRGGAR